MPCFLTAFHKLEIKAALALAKMKVTSTLNDRFYEREAEREKMLRHFFGGDESVC